ncbi:hypothetical protein G6F42_014163 [Rhizopus arrhizus]|nr:hypothetical protein G6F42_014163 [Rhizopus arrhizus]
MVSSYSFLLIKLLPGSLNVYAYMNDDNTRAFINLRMNVAGVRPYPNVDDNNNLIPSEAVRMTADKYDNKKLHKLKYMLYRYVWENIENEDMVEQEKLVKDSFAIYLSDLHDDLCDMNLIIDGETLNPVVIKETFAKKKKSKKLAERRREVEYLFNEEKVPRVDWEHPAMKLDKLLDSKTPLPRELVYLPPTAEASSSEERSGEASPMHT